MEIKRREPYDKNHVMYYKDLEEFFIPELEISIAKEQKYQLYQVYIMTTEYGFYLLNLKERGGLAYRLHIAKKM